MCCLGDIHTAVWFVKLHPSVNQSTRAHLADGGDELVIVPPTSAQPAAGLVKGQARHDNLRVAGRDVGKSLRSMPVEWGLSTRNTTLQDP